MTAAGEVEQQAASNGSQQQHPNDGQQDQQQPQDGEQVSLPLASVDMPSRCRGLQQRNRVAWAAVCRCTLRCESSPAPAAARHAAAHSAAFVRCKRTASRPPAGGDSLGCGGRHRRQDRLQQARGAVWMPDDRPRAGGADRAADRPPCAPLPQARHLLRAQARLAQGLPHCWPGLPPLPCRLPPSGPPVQAVFCGCCALQGLERAAGCIRAGRKVLLVHGAGESVLV